LRLFAFFFLLSSALGAALPLPAFAADDKKELSEEEEIALMMNQLEQFKASWESKDQAPTAVLSDTAPAALPSPATTIRVKENAAAIIPVEPALQVKPSSKTKLVPEVKAKAAEVKSGMAGASADLQPTSKSLAMLKDSLKTSQESQKSEPAMSLKAVPAAAKKELGAHAALQTDNTGKSLALSEKNVLPALPQAAAPTKTAEKAAFVEPKTEETVIPALVQVEKAEASKVEARPSAVLPAAVIPLKPIPAENLKKAVPAVETKLKAKEASLVPQKKVEEAVFENSPTLPDKELLEKLNLPKAAALTVPAAEKKKAVPEEKPEVPPVEQKPVKAKAAALSAAQSEPGPDDIVIVQDEAAEYRAAREQQNALPQSAREAVGMAPRQAGTGAQNDAESRVIESDEAKVLGRSKGIALPGDPRSQTRSKWVAARRGGPVKKEPPKPNLFADTFYLTSEQRLAYDVYDLDGFIFVKSPNPALNTKYAVVTGFGGGAMKTRAIPNLQTLEEAKKWVSEHQKTEEFESVAIKKLSLGKDGNAKELYWVGQKAYPDFKTAQQEVAVVQSVVTSQGGDFARLVADAPSYTPLTDGAKGAEIKGPANFEREEALMLKYLDQLDVGEKLFGPFQGDSSGESFSWQSFGETTWRRTNLDRTDYRSQVGFWTNRVVFKGFRFPMNTVDAFLEDTISLDSTSSDFSSNMTLFAGLEWRPFARNAWLYNYRPWGGISVLEWVKNFRFYLMYGERKAIKDPIEGSADTDLLAGVQIFYEWGVELPPLDQREPKTFSDFVEQYFWGEYFGNYRHEMTNFGSEDDYNSWLGGSSVTMGVKLPGIPLPANPINEELMLMPYMRFEHVNSAEFSFPYQNQYFVAAGMRWMPWRNYRFKENEWLSKAKFFGEYVGVGLTQHAKQDEEAPNAVRWDLRFGVSFSSRRY